MVLVKIRERVGGKAGFCLDNSNIMEVEHELYSTILISYKYVRCGLLPAIIAVAMSASPA